MRAHPRLQLFNRWFHSTGLWHLNRCLVPGAIKVGLVWAFIPANTDAAGGSLCHCLAR